jgi:hypothetical protein
MYSTGKPGFACRIIVWALMIFNFGVTRQSAVAQEEPPVAGQPVNFSGAIGSFEVTTRASPTQVLAEEPILLTLRISGTGNLAKIPRPQLDRLPRWQRSFQVRNAGERFLPGKMVREFDYHLRPRTPEVTQIPPFPFVYWKPNLIPPEKGYMTTYVPAIPIAVSRRPSVQANQIEGPVAAQSVPASVLVFPAALDLLVEQESRHRVPLWVWVLGLVAPPSLAIAWQVAWQLRRQDRPRGALRRRSKAALRALSALHLLGELPRADQPARAQEIVSDYLHTYLPMLPREPTPLEIVEHLRSGGFSPSVISAAGAFFDRCASARFGPCGPNSADWKSEADDIVERLEVESCVAHS